MLTNSTTVEDYVSGELTARKIVTIQRDAGQVRRTVQILRVINDIDTVVKTEVGSLPAAGGGLPVPVISGTGDLGDPITYTPGTVGAVAEYMVGDIVVHKLFGTRPFRPTRFLAGKVLTLRETVNGQTVLSNSITISRVDGGVTIPSNDLYGVTLLDNMTDTNRARINNTGAIPAGSSIAYRNQMRWGPDTTINDEKQRYVVDNDFGHASNPAAQALSFDPFAFTGGKLVVSGRRATGLEIPHLDGRTWLSGVFTTQGVHSQRNGVWRATIEYDAELGLWPAVWLLLDSKREPWEIDAFEGDGSEPNGGYHNLVTPPAVRGIYGTQDLSGLLPLPDGASVTDPFDIEVHVLDGTVEYYVNGVLRHTSTGEINEKMYLVVTLAISSGPFVPSEDVTTASPVSMKVSSIQAWQRPSEAAKGPTVVSKPTIAGTGLVGTEHSVTADAVVQDSASSVKYWASGAYPIPSSSAAVYFPVEADLNISLFRVEEHTDAAGDTVVVVSEPIYIQDGAAAGNKVYDFTQETFPSGAVVARAAGVATYTAADGFITEAAANAPRIEFDGATRRGLWVEESMQNIVTHGRSPGNGGVWALLGTPTLTFNHGTAPNGLTESTRVQVPAFATGVGIRYGTSISAGPARFTAWVRSLTGATQAVNIRSVETGNWALVNVPTTWTKITTVGNIGGSNYFSGDIVSGEAAIDIEVWGVELVPNGKSTGSVIPTVNAAITRPAETVQLSVVNGTYNVVLTFDDDSTQTLSDRVVAAGVFVLPAMLQRSVIKSVEFVLAGGGGSTGGSAGAVTDPPTVAASVKTVSGGWTVPKPDTAIGETLYLWVTAEYKTGAAPAVSGFDELFDLVHSEAGGSSRSTLLAKYVDGGEGSSFTINNVPSAALGTAIIVSQAGQLDAVALAPLGSFNFSTPPSLVTPSISVSETGSRVYHMLGMSNHARDAATPSGLTPVANTAGDPAMFVAYADADSNAPSAEWVTYEAGTTTFAGEYYQAATISIKPGDNSGGFGNPTGAFANPVAPIGTAGGGTGGATIPSGSTVARVLYDGPARTLPAAFIGSHNDSTDIEARPLYNFGRGARSWDVSGTSHSSSPNFPVLQWAEIEISPGTYYWDNVDQWVAENPNCELIFTPDGCPTFYQKYPGESYRYPYLPGGASPPTAAGLVALQAFLVALLTRHPSIRYIENVNEANFGFNSTDLTTSRWTEAEYGTPPFFSGTANDLADKTKVIFDAIAQAVSNGVVTACELLVGGWEGQFNDSSVNSARRLKAALDGKGYGFIVTAISIHLYDYTSDPSVLIDNYIGYNTVFTNIGWGGITKRINSEMGSENPLRLSLLPDVDKDRNIKRWCFIGAAFGYSVYLYKHNGPTLGFPGQNAASAGAIAWCAVNLPLKDVTYAAELTDERIYLRYADDTSHTSP